MSKNFLEMTSKSYKQSKITMIKIFREQIQIKKDKIKIDLILSLICLSLYYFLNLIYDKLNLDLYFIIKLICYFFFSYLLVAFISYFLLMIKNIKEILFLYKAIISYKKHC